jgi:hypothetical protein
LRRNCGITHRFTITCNDNKLSLVFNGEEVWNIDLDDWNEAKKNADGTKNKFPVALKDFARKGPIGRACVCQLLAGWV